MGSSVLGSTYFGAEKLLALETTLCLDANYQLSGCGATADGYGHFDDLVLNQGIQRAAYRSVQLAVRYALCYRDADSLFQDVSLLMRQIGKSMKQSFLHPESCGTASCVLTRVFIEPTGKEATVVAAGIGDGMVISIDPKTNKLHTLIHPRQYDRGGQYTPISITENFKEEMLQTCQKTLPLGSIVIRMTDGAWQGLPYRCSGRQLDAQTNRAYLSYALDLEKLEPLLADFSEDYPEANANTYRQFLLQVIQQNVERNRQFLLQFSERLTTFYHLYLSESPTHSAHTVWRFIQAIEERRFGFEKDFKRFWSLLGYPLETTTSLTLKEFELPKLKLSLGDDIALNVEIVGNSALALRNTSDFPHIDTKTLSKIM